MQDKMNTKVVALSLGVFIPIIYVICVIWDILFPQYSMYPVWAPLLPGFTWISAGSFILGLIETVIYGVFGGALFAVIYNYFLERYA